MRSNTASASLSLLSGLFLCRALNGEVAPKPRSPAREGASLSVVITDPLARENACACVKGFAQRDYSAFASYLQKRLGRPVRVVFGNTLSAAERQIGHQPDLIVGKRSEVELEAKECGDPVRLVAMLTDKTGVTTLRGLFVVGGQDEARTLADLRGRKILFGPKCCDERHSSAFAALRAVGVPVPAEPRIEELNAAAALSVLEKEADAAVISDYGLALLVGCGSIGKGELRALGQTEATPFVGAFVTSRVPPVQVQGICQALLGVAKDKALLVKLESKYGFVRPTVRSAPASSGWTDWRGNALRDARSKDVPQQLPATPTFLWRKKVSSQSPGGIAATSRYVILSDKSGDGRQDLWRCLDADTGNQVWQLSYPAYKTMDFTCAPRATPVVVGNKAYLLGALGDLYCVSLDRGKAVWHCNLVAKFGGDVPTWGFCGTPLVIGDRVVVNTASTSAALVTLDRHTGRVLWKALGRKPGYGNLIVGVFGGKRQIVGYDATTAGGWDIETGRRLWTLKPPVSGDFNVPTPVQVGDRLLLSTAQNGTRLYGFRGDGTINPKPVAVNEALTPDTTSPVLADGLVWGSCYNGAFCLDPADNLKTLWHTNDEGYCDHACFIAGNGHVLMLKRNGTLALLPSRPQPDTKPANLVVFTPHGDSEPEAWSHPALVGNRLYLRSESEVVCLLLETRVMRIGSRLPRWLPFHPA